MSCTGLLVTPIFLPDHALTRVCTALQEHLGNAVGVLDGDIGLPLGQRRKGFALAQGGKQGLAVFTDFFRGHRCTLGRFHIDSGNNIYIVPPDNSFIDIFDQEQAPWPSN